MIQRDMGKGEGVGDGDEDGGVGGWWLVVGGDRADRGDTTGPSQNK